MYNKVSDIENNEKLKAISDELNIVDLTTNIYDMLCFLKSGEEFDEELLEMGLTNMLEGSDWDDYSTR